MGIEELMNRAPATCGPDESLSEAEQKMQNSNCGFLPVIAADQSQCLVGIITDGDIDMATQLRGRHPEELRVRDAMAKEIRTCNPQDSLLQAEAIMQETDIRCLPVVDESGCLLGVLSRAAAAYGAEQAREALRSLASAAQFALLASRIHEPHRAGEPTRVTRRADALEARGGR
jgi:CBS-domain-containing membrane protein